MNMMLCHQNVVNQHRFIHCDIRNNGHICNMEQVRVSWYRRQNGMASSPLEMRALCWSVNERTLWAVIVSQLMAITLDRVYTSCVTNVQPHVRWMPIAYLSMQELALCFELQLAPLSCVNPARQSDS